MAIGTSTTLLAPEDGWTLLVSNPASCLIRSEDGPWEIYIGASLPVAGTSGFPMAATDVFSIGAITGNIYVRTTDFGRSSGKTAFVVIAS